MKKSTITIIILLISMLYTNIWHYKSQLRTEELINSMSEKVYELNAETVIFDKVNLKFSDLKELGL